MKPSTSASSELASACFALLRRDMAIAYRRRGEALHPPMFFVLAVALFVLATNPQPQFLQTIAGGILWVTALFATLLALDGMFRQDLADGFLEQLLLSPHPPTVLVASKVLAHWLVSGVPLLLIAPLLAAMLHLPWHAWPALLLSLLLGTPALSLLGALGSALTLATRSSGALLALLMLPLYTPILIFGAGAVRAAVFGLNTSGPLAWLGAILLLVFALAPASIVAALRISLH